MRNPECRLTSGFAPLSAGIEIAAVTFPLGWGVNPVRTVPCRPEVEARFHHLGEVVGNGWPVLSIGSIIPWWHSPPRAALFTVLFADGRRANVSAPKGNSPACDDQRR